MCETFSVKRSIILLKQVNGKLFPEIRAVDSIRGCLVKSSAVYFFMEEIAAREIYSGLCYGRAIVQCLHEKMDKLTMEGDFSYKEFGCYR